MDLNAALAHLGGVATTQELLSAGVRKRDLAHALQDGQVLRPTRGIYTVARPPLALLVRKGWGAELTCASALRHFNLPARTAPSGLHLALPATHSTGRGHRRLPQRAHAHYFGRMPALTERDALDTASRCLTPLGQLIAIDQALNRGTLLASDLNLFTHTPRARLGWLIDHCDAGAGSPPEAIARVALVEAGLHVRTQVSIPFLGRVDFLIDHRVIVEGDGHTYHMDEQAFSRDRARDREALARWGLPTLRFTRHDVENATDQMVDLVRHVVSNQRELWCSPFQSD